MTLNQDIGSGNKKEKIELKDMAEAESEKRVKKQILV